MITLTFMAVVMVACVMLYDASQSNAPNKAKRQRIYFSIPTAPHGLLSLRNERTLENVEKDIKDKSTEYENLTKLINDRGDQETDEETTKLENLVTEIENLDKEKARLVRKQRFGNIGNRRLNPLGGLGTNINDGESSDDETKIENKGPAFLNDKSGRMGYTSFGNFLQDVQDSAQGQVMSEQMTWMANQESFSADSGFSVPVGFVNACDPCLTPDDEGRGGLLREQQQLNSLMMLDGGEEDALFSSLNTGQLPMSRPSVKIPYLRDKDHRGGLFGGVVVTDKPDSACFEQLSTLNFGKLEMEVGQTYAMFCAHNLLLRDSAISLESLFRSGVSRGLRFDAIEKILYGNKAGNHKGMFPDGDPTKNPALIRVGRTFPGQTTLHLDDLLNMRMHCYGYSGAQWWGSTTTFTELVKLNLSIVAAGQPAIFTFDFNSGEGALLGRPIRFSDDFVDCNGLCLFHAGHYLTADYQGPEWASSTHVMWLCDKSIFRVAVRRAGTPWWECAMVPRRCETPKSPFVCLGETWHMPLVPEMDTTQYLLKSGCSGTCVTSSGTQTVNASKAESVSTFDSQQDLSKLSKADLMAFAQSSNLELTGKETKAALIEMIQSGAQADE